MASEQKRVAGVVGSQPAALDHLQRFGGSLNLNLHYHAIFTDGVFAAEGEGRVRFHETGAPSASEAATGAEPMKPRLAVGQVELTHQGISVRHLDRLVGGLLLATSPRVAWATRIRRTHGCDVLACGGGGGRLRVLNARTEPAIARKILDHLGWRAVPVRPRGRDPADDELGRVGASSTAE